MILIFLFLDWSGAEARPRFPGDYFESRGKELARNIAAF
jgi:hypothetical protein